MRAGEIGYVRSFLVNWQHESSPNEPWLGMYVHVAVAQLLGLEPFAHTGADADASEAAAGLDSASPRETGGSGAG